MVKVEFSKQSLIDLESIFGFISRDSIKYAKYQIDLLIHQTELISEFALIGHKNPEKNDETIREIVKGNYRIIYKIHKSKISILTFHHTKKRLII
jgi:toxin ParE1/3/4